MRKNTILAVVAALACLAMGPAAVKSLEQETLKGYIEKGSPFSFILIDVRGADEVAEGGGIGNAQCKPYNLAWPEQLQQECKRIPRNRSIVVYCRSGARAAMAAAYLESAGFANVYNAGGFLSWTGPTVPLSEFKPASLLPAPSMKAKAVRKKPR